MMNAFGRELPHLGDDAEAELLDQRGAGLDDEVVVVREFLEHLCHLVHVDEVKRDLQVGRVPEPGDLESHDCVGSPVFFVDECLCVGEFVECPVDREFGCTVVVTVDLVVVQCLRVNKCRGEDHDVFNVAQRQKHLLPRSPQPLLQRLPGPGQTSR